MSKKSSYSNTQSAGNMFLLASKICTSFRERFQREFISPHFPSNPFRDLLQLFIKLTTS
jgi:hypothetical protein